MQSREELLRLYNAEKQKAENLERMNSILRRLVLALSKNGDQPEASKPENRKYFLH